MKNNVELTKKDLNQASVRWLFGSQICWNYERMMSTGYLYTMMPTLEKIYDDKDELRTVMENHNQFFNTNPMMGSLIVGINMAIEEKEGIDSIEVVTGIKTGLMGPFAGVGDTIFGVLIPTICGSIAAYMGQKGNVTGVVIWLLVNILVIAFRFLLLPMGYRQGTKLIDELGDKLSAFTDAAILLGVTVVGALIPTVINAKIPYIYQSGEVEMALQDIMDQIMPALIPALLVGLIYYLLGKKGMTSTKAILLIMVLSIVFYNLHILG